MAKLAINGEKPAISEKLKTRWPIYDEAEKQALIEVLESGRWCCAGQTEGKVAQAERAFAKFIGVKYAMMVPTGTTAIELALRACGVGAGDEVIVPAVTFVATASAVVVANAVPVFADIDPETYQISPDAVDAAITNKTRAILPVHYGGYPANMDRIMEIAKKHDLFVVEDCAEAHGSEWRGQKVGSIGNAGAFSFQMGKPLTGGEGGAITYNDEALRISCYGYSRTVKKAGGEEETYHIPAGNWRMSEFVGAILLAQMSRIVEQTEVRYQNGEYFAQELEKIGGIRALKREPRITKRGYYFYLLRYDASKWNGVPRNKFMEALRAEGASCGTAHNDPVYWNPAFKNIRKYCPFTCSHYGKEVDYSKVYCPEAERIYKTEVVAMGKDFLMEKENVNKILEAIHKLRENTDELNELNK